MIPLGLKACISIQIAFFTNDFLIKVIISILFTGLIFNKGVHDPSGIESLCFDTGSTLRE